MSNSDRSFAVQAAWAEAPLDIEPYGGLMNSLSASQGFDRPSSATV